MTGIGIGILVVIGLVVGWLAWRESWTRCKYQIRRLPEHEPMRRELV